MQIQSADKEIDGKLSEQFLATLSTTGWFNYEWKCIGCEAIFTNVMDLEKHSIKCTKRRCINSCCLKEFPSYSTFINHVTEKHQNILKYSCIVCSEFRWNFIDLYRHCETHDEHSIFFCLYCGKNFFTGALLRDHLIIHRPDAILPDFSCDLCDYKTYKKQVLLSHMSRYHLERRFTCECCAFSFKYRAELIQHQQSKHSDECSEECRVCGKKFKNKRKLRRHVKNMHEESLIVFSCEICGKKSKSKKLHSTHMKVSKNSKINSLLIKLIFFRFTATKNHINAHTAIEHSNTHQVSLIMLELTRVKDLIFVLSKVAIKNSSIGQTVGSTLELHMDSWTLNQFQLKQKVKVLPFPTVSLPR